MFDPIDYSNPKLSVSRTRDAAGNIVSETVSKGSEPHPGKTTVFIGTKTLIAVLLRKLADWIDDHFA
ncbi:MAG: hypothetical protein FD161_72 [Limisphaerales bacterium]|nr:MAG: hypothetical protein FD161_72 [Limisphaerales bacterium]KAG0510518.1 MAG: hypothetical protein E1N63_72 [Limisphaerales bacterium]TXT52791.1 MAG: hypothetical protein FD140_334 [Limisphaerales bacterium]